jgi:c(7)-type cytochrome triheme protein
MLRVLAVAAVSLSLLARVRAAEGSGQPRRRLPQEYGRVVLQNHAARSKTPPVEFDHWLHRARFTCRVCHVDIGFAMKAGATDIRAVDNAKGVYCGACHNGRLRIAGETVFEACRAKEKPDVPACARCHSVPDAPYRKIDFASFTKAFPRARFGNGIDWEEAEKKGVIKPLDDVEGVSFKRPRMGVQRDFALAAKLAGMPDIIFSHAKHTVWNGCEVCHPEIFNLKRGATKVTMIDIFDGKYCGACHVSVGFPTTDCNRCHVNPVQ